MSLVKIECNSENGIEVFTFESEDAMQRYVEFRRFRCFNYEKKPRPGMFFEWKRASKEPEPVSKPVVLVDNDGVVTDGQTINDVMDTLQHLIDKPVAPVMIDIIQSAIAKDKPFTFLPDGWTFINGNQLAA